MGVVLHIYKDGKIHNLALDADEFRKETVFNLIRADEVILTFSGKDIAGYTYTLAPNNLKRRLDASLSVRRANLLLEQQKIRTDTEYNRMIGRA